MNKPSVTIKMPVLPWTIFDNKQLGELISQQLEFCRDVVSKLYTK